jgi:hypothetical protein
VVLYRRYGRYRCFRHIVSLLLFVLFLIIVSWRHQRVGEWFPLSIEEHGLPCYSFAVDSSVCIVNIWIKTGNHDIQAGLIRNINVLWKIFHSSQIRHSSGFDFRNPKRSRDVDLYMSLSHFVTTWMGGWITYGSPFHLNVEFRILLYYFVSARLHLLHRGYILSILHHHYGLAFTH